MSDRVAMWAAAGLAALFAGWRFWRLMGARVNDKAVIAAGDEIQFGQVLVRVSSGPGAPR